MKRISPGAQKALKLVHLSCSFLWLSCILLLLVTPLVLTKDVENGAVRMFVRIYHLIDICVLSPAATLTLLTGLVYSLFTNWGFAKHGWIIFKWVVTLFMVLWGTFYLGPSVKALLAWSIREQSTLAQHPFFQNSMDLAIKAAMLNLTIIVLAVVASVYKPWKNIR